MNDKYIIIFLRLHSEWSLLKLFAVDLEHCVKNHCISEIIRMSIDKVLELGKVKSVYSFIDEICKTDDRLTREELDELWNRFSKDTLIKNHIALYKEIMEVRARR